VVLAVFYDFFDTVSKHFFSGYFLLLAVR